MQLTRRNVLIGGGAILASGSFGGLSLLGQSSRSISIYVPETGERDFVTFWENGGYIADGIASINQLLRDFRTDEVGSINLNLLDVLYAVMASYDGRAELEVVRGHMSNPEESPYVTGSPNAFHNAGTGVDVRVRGVTMEHLAADFIRWVDGGVGMYPKQNFVHLDIGPTRRWIG